MVVKIIQPITQPSGKVWPVGSTHEVTWDKAAELIELGVAEHYVQSNPVLEKIEDRRSKEKKESRKN